MLVVDHNREILEELAGVSSDELEPRVLALQRRFGADARVLVDGRHVRMVPRRNDGRPSARATQEMSDDEMEVAVDASLRLAHSMMWESFERVTQAQEWMLEQAADFTRQLIDGNRRLAEHASDLQRCYREKLAELDYAAHEMKLIEQEAAARSLSRHIIEKSAAEVAASRPGRGGGVLDDLIDGATSALECWVKAHAGDPKDWKY